MDRNLHIPITLFLFQTLDVSDFHPVPRKEGSNLPHVNNHFLTK